MPSPAPPTVVDELELATLEHYRARHDSGAVDDVDDDLAALAALRENDTAGLVGWPSEA